MENEQVISNDFLENQTLLEKLTSIDSLKIQEPVMLADGYTYEKALIEEWLKLHDISPITKLKLAHKDLMPNHTLKQLQLKCQQLSKENESLKMHQVLFSEQFIQATHFINTLKENIKQHEELMEKIKNQKGIIQQEGKSIGKIEIKLVKENPRLSVNIIFLLLCFKFYNKVVKQNKSPVPKPIQHNIFNFFFQGANEFVSLVYSGNLKAVEKILQEHPNLAFVQTDIKDLSNREFKRMSGFQYAVWSLDSEMWILMLQYVDKKRAAYQFHELQHDRLDITNYHDLYIDFNPLIKVYQDYVNYLDSNYGYDVNAVTTPYYENYKKS